jgi:hypothetical protein
MRKYILLPAVLLCANIACYAQRNLATQQQASDFFKGRTYVVTTNDNIVLDALLLEAVAKVWKATPYKVVDNAAFKELRTDPQNSFLLVTKVKNSSDKLQRHYLFLSLLLGSEKAAINLDAMPELSSLPFAGDVVETNNFMLEPALLFVQKDAENMSNGMFKKSLLFSFEDRMKAYNQNMETLKTKTLYVAESQVDKAVKLDMAATQCSGKLVALPALDDFEGIVKNGNEDAVFALAIYPDNISKGIFAYKIVLGRDGTLYYYYRERDSKRFKFLTGDFDMWIAAYKKGE